MPALHLRSVRHKLLLVMLAANFLVLVAAGGSLLYHDLNEYRKSTVSALTTLAGILGQGSAVALDFNDAKVARENLSLLSANPDIVAAAIYDVRGDLFAYYGNPRRHPKNIDVSSEADGFTFEDQALIVFKHISTGDEVVGTVYVTQSFNLWAWLKNYLIILGIILIVSLGFGVAISTRLQRWISGPIQAVSNVARQIMEQRDYRLRAVKSTEDEIGQLADAVNGMLETLEHEIAERSSAEQEVRVLNTDLEQRVVDRTAELQIVNQRLVHRTEEAEMANRAKADFLANMSHEIRTPMNAILGLAYLLEQTDLDSDAADLVKKIRNAGRSLQSIINDILDLSKIEAGRLEIEYAPFRLADVLDNLASIMAASVGNKDIELVIAPPPDIGVQLIGDALRLEQVLINLTNNAIKFTAQGSVKVDIDLLARDATNVQLRFSVKDTGIGIAQDNQAQIFSAFSQADVSTTRRFGGTGLGLTICKHLVAQMGGEIDVISKAGAGSEFWFTIPFKWCEATEPEPPVLAMLEVLIVDSNDVSLENLSGIVTSFGWKVTLAESSAGALQEIQQKLDRNEIFNAILVDWKVGEMNGLEAARCIATQFKEITPPMVLVMPAAAREQLPKQEEINFVRAVLSKPVTGSAIYDVISDVVQPQKIHKASQSAARVKGTRLVGFHALVVDDNAVNREVAMRFLMSEGARVTLAEDGKTAVDWVNENPGAVDIVFMDVQMPVMDGYEATRQLRALKSSVNLPIVALTAGVFKDQIDAAQAAGMNAFVAKPFNIDELVNAIQTLVTKSDA
jgi:signal transduction histidine kinase/CheY-like chemotaxis protein